MAHVGHGALIGRGTYRAWHIQGVAHIGRGTYTAGRCHSRMSLVSMENGQNNNKQHLFLLHPWLFLKEISDQTRMSVFILHTLQSVGFDFFFKNNWLVSRWNFSIIYFHKSSHLHWKHLTIIENMWIKNMKIFTVVWGIG